MRRAIAAWLAMLGPGSALAHAAATTAWEMNAYADFVRGRFAGISLSRDGRLMLAPKLDPVFASDQAVVWAMAQAPGGKIYAATGHRGRLFSIDGSGKSNLEWTSPQPEIFALAVDARGTPYAGTSPDGKVYRIDGNKATEFFSPGATYVWALAFGRDGMLYVGTGDGGKVFRVDPAGRGEVYYETGQTHVTSLAVDTQGRVLAGTEPNGILFRITAKDSAFVLHDANLPEIRSIIAAADGSVYAAAMGGSTVSRTTPSAPGAATPAGAPMITSPAITVTVTEEAQAGLEVKPKPEPPKPGALTPAGTPGPAIYEMAGVEKSALYRILPDNTVETLWSSKEENIYDVLDVGGHLLFATDGGGRVYRYTSDRRLTLLAQTNEGEITRLLRGPAGVLASSSGTGKIVRLGEGWSTEGSFESPVHDAQSVARWGRMTWRTESCAGCRVAFRTRSGNSSRPDRTWSEWSEPVVDLSGVRSPNARYLQWKLELTGSNGNSPVVEAVTVAYLPQNVTPVVRSITVMSQFTASAAGVKPGTPAAAGAYSITVTDTGDAGPPTAAGTPTQNATRAANQQLQITWQAEDTDGDKLVYAVHFRGEGEREWKLLKDNLAENQLLLDSDVLADGRYLFRVTATDRLVNPPETAREDDLISSPVLIDYTPPVVTIRGIRRNGEQLEADVEAVDATSPLRRAEYSVDASPWTPMQSADGILDGPSERLVLRVGKLSAGEHLVVVRAYDAAGNAGLAKVVVR